MAVAYRLQAECIAGERFWFIQVFCSFKHFIAHGKHQVAVVC